VLAQGGGANVVSGGQRPLAPSWLRAWHTKWRSRWRNAWRKMI